MQKEIEINVPFFDVDPMQVVWHGHYIKYMEMARCALLSDMRMNYNDMHNAGYVFPIVSLRVKYIRPCVFGQIILARAILVPSDNFLIFKYEIIDKETGKKLCRAETKQMVVDMKTRESLYEIPEPFLTIIRNAK